MKVTQQGKVCSVEDCGRPAFSRGWCRKHHQRWYKWGSPTKTVNVTPDMSRLERFNWYGHIITESGCWEWAGDRFPKGYGKFPEAGVKIGAHRIAYELFKGAIPLGMLIRHKCDNPPCVNPDHLEVGTTLDNTRDMWDRGRNKNASGFDHYAAKLSRMQVKEIRDKYSTGNFTQQQLGAEYGVNKQSINNVVNHKTYAELDKGIIDIESEES